MSRQRDRTTVRRALRAGAVAGGGVGGLLLVVAVASRAGIETVTAVMSGVAVGALVTAGWLLLAALLDVLAGDYPGRRRLLWTLGATVLALLGPFLVVGTLTPGAA